MSAEQGTNTLPEEEQFTRTYREWNPNNTQGPDTEVLATILKPEGS